MDRSTKMFLILALFLSTFVVSLEGRNIPDKPKPYQPQNIVGFGGFFSPGLGGGSGLVPLGPQFGLGTPAFGSFPGFGGVPVIPHGGLGGHGAAAKP